MSLDSRNSANRSNKPIASGLAKGPGKIRVQHHDNDKNDSDEEDDDDDDDILGRSGEDLRQSFGKKTGGLAQLKAKLSLQEELGALKSELSDFDNSIQKKENSQPEKTDAAWSAVKNMDEVQERDDADDLDDDDDDDDDEMDDGGRLTAKDLVTTMNQSNSDKSDTSASDTNEESKAKADDENDTPTKEAIQADCSPSTSSEEESKAQ